MTAIGKSAIAISPLAAAVLAALAAGPVRGGAAYFIPGDPKVGMQIFFDKGCVRCHAIQGEGGRLGPDLARAPVGHLDAAELVAAMWNHAPGMWQKMRLDNVNSPRFSPAEMTDLFAFLYSVRSLDEPGDPARGRKLLEEKKCLSCHAIAGQGGSGGPDLRQLAGYRNPVTWVQAMWNHGAAMQSMMERRGMGWPQFRGNEMADLIAAVRSLAANPRTRAQLQHANAEGGRRTFLEKRCDACHAIRGSGARRGPDLGARTLPRTLGQFAGIMWNHAPAMWNSMQAQGVSRPRFSDQEMADLIAYLFTERYFEAAGNSDRGARMFADKGCGNCHGVNGSAPDVRNWRGAASPISMAAALWNHGPLMLAAMQQRQIVWPLFRGGEMADLMDFLNRGAPARVSAAKNGRPRR